MSRSTRHRRRRFLLRGWTPAVTPVVRPRPSSAPASLPRHHEATAAKAVGPEEPPAYARLRLRGVTLDFRLPRPWLTAGRGPECDLVLDDPRAAPLEALLYWRPTSGWWAIPLDVGDVSAGLGTPLPTAGRFARWRWRHVDLRLPSLTPAVSAGSNAAEDGVSAGPHINLRPLGVRQAPPSEVAEALTLVGRDRRCGLLAEGASIRPFHAVLLRTAAAVVVIPLAASPVDVNGQRVTAAYLDPGDTLRIGSSRWEVQWVGLDASADTPDEAVTRYRYRPAETPAEQRIAEAARRLRQQFADERDAGHEPSGSALRLEATTREFLGGDEAADRPADATA